VETGKRIERTPGVSRRSPIESATLASGRIFQWPRRETDKPRVKHLKASMIATVQFSINLALKKLAGNSRLLSDVSQKQIGAAKAVDFLGGFYNVSDTQACACLVGWVVLCTLDVLDTIPTVICYCNKTCSLALALNFNRFHKTFLITNLVPNYHNPALGIFHVDKDAQDDLRRLSSPSFLSLHDIITSSSHCGHTHGYKQHLPKQKSLSHRWMS